MSGKANNYGAVAKASLIRAIESLGVNAKRDDLGMGRMKPG